MPFAQWILNLAMKQGGVVSRRQLLDGGRSPKWIDRQVATGHFTVIKSGIYRVLDMSDHIDVLRAATTTLPNAVVSHESAAHLLRFPALPRLRPTVTVHARTTHLFPGVTVRRNADLESSHTVMVHGLRATGILRTLFDLAGVISEHQVDQMVEGLVIDGRLHPPALGDFARSLSRKGKPGSRSISSIIERRGGTDATKLERMGLSIIRARGFPEPVIQYPAPWNEAERIDAAWPPQRAGIEWDSTSWHAAIDRMANDRRRDRAAALHGWAILRYTWKDVTEHADEVGDEIARLLMARSA